MSHLLNKSALGERRMIMPRDHTENPAKSAWHKALMMVVVYQWVRPKQTSKGKWWILQLSTSLEAFLEDVA